MNDSTRPAPAMAAKQHPRRPLAHQSVSLRHSPPAATTASRPNAHPHRKSMTPAVASSPTAASNKANPPSSVSPKLLANTNSSGESSDAGAWFDSTNKHALQTTASFNENDPPFFLRNASSSETPPDTGFYPHGHAGNPHRTNLAPVATDGSSTEDFRSVIDDLTVVNKRLKQKLRRYEKMYDAHLQEEKLFEVRFHGLPDHKKKELEETLRKFASELDDSAATTNYPSIQSHLPALHAHNTVSATSRFAESGYVSMSASGRNSSAASNLQEKDRPKFSKSAYNRQQQTIHSYLHDIPIGLLPDTNHVQMTDKAKKKMVVRRLEQIFAGKMSAPGNHPQPMQQEEVAQLAATADREQREATGQLFRPEGLREARIMPAKNADDEDALDQPEPLHLFRPVFQLSEQEWPGSCSSPDQRPTRPLDLDPARAQVPMENMDYFRHLGFTPPDMATGVAQPIGHGWIYLNLLINMAQLHTLNVTPDFVKDALHEYSSFLETSRDGRKIRWKGGQNVTVHSGGSSSEHRSSVSPDENVARPYPKHTMTGTSGASSENTVGPEHKARRLLRIKRESEQNKFAYKPLFFRKEESDDDEDMEMESTSGSPFQPQLTGNSSGFGSSAMQSSSSKPKLQPKRNDGPMIFYNKAKFCTDLSGDRVGATLTNPGAYKAITSHPLGASSTLSHVQAMSDLAEPRGALNTAPLDIDSRSGAAMSSEDDFGFSPDSLIHDSGNNTPDMVVFEASGLGGVHPEDNFSVHVRRSQISTAQTSIPRRRRSSLYPQKIINALSPSSSPELKVPSPRASPQRVIKEEILSTSRKSMPNSALPPASFLPFDSTSSGDMSDVSEIGSSEPDSESEDGPTTAFQILNLSTLGQDHTTDDSDEESQYSVDTDEDGSVDLLATARQLDPTTIRASEREYDAALAERLADVIPAGSSAATAAGGSGFNTPAHKHAATGSIREATSARKPKQSPPSGSVSSRTRNLKRARTSESITSTNVGGGGGGGGGLGGAKASGGSKGLKSQRLER